MNAAASRSSRESLKQWNDHAVTGVITASEPSWITPFTAGHHVIKAGATARAAQPCPSPGWRDQMRPCRPSRPSRPSRSSGSKQIQQVELLEILIPLTT